MADSVADQFRGLPKGELIGNPLMASNKAQYPLATTMFDFINEIGFDGSNPCATYRQSYH